jgi:hypothetical protein
MHFGSLLSGPRYGFKFALVKASPSNTPISLDKLE